MLNCEFRLKIGGFLAVDAGRRWQEGGVNIGEGEEEEGVYVNM